MHHRGRLNELAHGCEEARCQLPAIFQNRVAEVQRNLSSIQGKVQTLEPLQKVAGTLNPADIATRGRASLEDVDADSPWQKGPSFQLQTRDHWPISHPEDVPGAIPEGELRN